MTRFLTIVALTLGLTLGATVAPAYASSPAWSSNFYEYRIKANINDLRAVRGLTRLRVSTCADKWAERRARIVRDKRELVHSNMRTIIRDCGVRWAGEVIAVDDEAPSAIRRLWMQSPSHKKVLTNPVYRQVGVGSVRDRYGAWWTTAVLVRY